MSGVNATNPGTPSEQPSERAPAQEATPTPVPAPAPTPAPAPAPAQRPPTKPAGPSEPGRAAGNPSAPGGPNPPPSIGPVGYPAPPGGPVVPARPSALTRGWPGPAGGAAQAVLGTVAATAAVAAASIPLIRPGVGWLVSGTAGTAALVTAGWSGAREAGGWTAVRRRLGWTRLAWAVATLALLAVGTVRAAGWLFVLCLLTAGMTAALTVADGRSVRALLLSGLIPPAAVFRSMPWAAKGLTRPADRKSTRLNSSHLAVSRMPSSA